MTAAPALSRQERRRAAQLSVEEVARHLDVDFSTGEVRWRRNGRLAGHRRSDNGYVELGLGGKHYLAHRIVWAFAHGRWPVGEVDHKNRDTGDNRLCNLREASRLQNSLNTAAHHDSRSGLRGAYFHRPSGRYRAEFRSGGRYRHLGYFDTADEAHAAHIAALREEVDSDFPLLCVPATSLPSESLHRLNNGEDGREQLHVHPQSADKSSTVGALHEPGNS